ncbi:MULTISPECIES: carbon storage regulator [Pseudomonas]|uniref:Carbon storage regulator n=1 Tax=Pseudomonas fulva (strain 12-X) TaxID=743720 RepID=F6AAR8_PSEF1|nr:MULTISPECIES: carbon storage regulator [Pseudomonas]AEF22121.1 hypothetical protein Psefu_2150 [Pseudomonas fulva 12-X]PZW71290.1 carbon storage regulator CsrA [Pseudomonas sp. URMO17WK12:I1]
MPLTLTRRCGEEIQFRFPADLTEDEIQEMVRTGISVSVLDINSRQVQLSIAAPQSVNIVRSELLKK